MLLAHCSTLFFCPAHVMCFRLPNTLTHQGRNSTLLSCPAHSMCFQMRHTLMHEGTGAGMDIAAELALRGAAKTVLSCRRPVHVVPRWTFGKPSDIAVQPWCAPLDYLLPCPCIARAGSALLLIMSATPFLAYLGRYNIWDGRVPASRPVCQPSLALHCSQRRRI